MEKTEVLMVVAGLVNGGIERVVINIACSLNKDKFKVYVYCIDCKGAVYKEYLEQHGIIVVNHEIEKLQVSPGNKHVVLYQSLIKYIRQHPQITVLHNHSGNHTIEVLLAAQKCKLPVVVEHSHMAYSRFWNPQLFSWKSKIISKISKYLCKRIVNYKVGCSKAACRSKFGKTRDQYFIPNGVDYNVFSYDKIAGKIEIREKYHLKKEDIYFIFVGRFVEQKNPLFLLEVIAYLEVELKNVHLLLVGYGEMEKSIKKKIKELDISENVEFFPPESNVAELLKASDYFITPSITEGLGITFVEAQLMGIPAFASDQVPRDANIGMCEFIPLEGGSRKYAEYILDYIKSKKYSEKQMNPELIDMYDMNNVIGAYESIYQNKKIEVEKYHL